MGTGSVEIWLRQRQARQSWRHLGGGVLLALVSIPALVVTYLGCWVMCHMILDMVASFPGVSNGVLNYASEAAGVVLVLCFVGCMRSGKDPLAGLSFSTGTASDKVVHVSGYIPGVGMISGSTVNPLAPDSVHSAARIVSSVFFIAPTLAFRATGHFVRAWQVRRIGFADAARVLCFLARRPQRVPFGEIVENVPGIDVARAFGELSQVDGVLVLVTAPAGLSLNDRLRGELDRL